MSNRADRRKMMRETTARSKALLDSYDQQRRIDMLMRNGITPQDLKKEYERGRQDGWQMASEPIIKACYAGIAIALKDEFGFSNDDCYRALKAVDAKTVYCIDNILLADELLRKTGLQMDMDDPFERVVQID